MKKLFLTSLTLSVGLFCLGSAAAADTATRSTLEAKLALESSLEKRVQMVLSEALGTNDVIVIISAEMQQETQKKASLDFLPGIPEKEKVGEASISSSLTMVKKISATLILDRNLPEDDIKLARKLASGLLGVPADREDLISVEKMDFRKTKPFALADLLVPPNLWNVIWVVLIAVLGVMTVVTFFSPISRTTRNLVSIVGTKLSEKASDSGPGRAMEAALPTALPAEAAAAKKEAAGGENGKKPPFWFLNEGNTSNLAFILRNKTTEEITMVLNYAPRSVSSALIEALYPKSVEALAALPKVTLMPEAAVKALESELYAALDYVVGSEDKTMEIIEQLPEAMQQNAVTTLAAQNPALSKKVSESIVRFEDIKYLEPMHAQMLARRLPMKNLALAMKGSDIAQIFTDKLTEGMQERFRQELDLTRAVAPEVQRTERLRLAMEIKKLRNEGFLTLDRSGKAAAHAATHAAPPPSAPKPAAPAKPAAAGAKPGPVVTQISPTSMSAGPAPQTLIITGSNFFAGNVVQFKYESGPGAGIWKTGKPPAVKSDTQLTVAMNPGLSAGTVGVRVCRSIVATGPNDASSGTHSVKVTAAEPAKAPEAAK